MTKSRQKATPALSPGRGSQGAGSPGPGWGTRRGVRPSLGWHLLNSVPVRWARMRKERDWPVPGLGRQSSVSSISRCLLASGTSGRSGCLWGGWGSEPQARLGSRGGPSPDLIQVGESDGKRDGQGQGPAG